MVRESVITKIHKLSAHMESAKSLGSLKEAESFAAKIQELLLKHKLEMGEVELAVQNEEDPFGRFNFDPYEHGIKRTMKRVAWQEQLANQIAKSHFCRLIVITSSNQLRFVGRKTDVEVCTYLYAYLVRTFQAVSQKEYDRIYNEHYKNGTEGLIRGWRQSWLWGAVDTVAKRLKASRREFERVAGEGASKNALVQIQRAENEIVEFMEGLRGLGKAAGLTSAANNRSGYDDGAAYGRKVNLSRGVGSADGGGQRQIKG